MKKYFLFVSVLLGTVTKAQTLTVEKIMRDPKWIGASPSNVFWSYNSRQVIFSWNPDAVMSDSSYSYSIGGTAPVKIKYNDARIAGAINAGRYNKSRDKIVFEYSGDIYLLDIASGKQTRVTQTSEFETNPVFTGLDKWISYQRGINLYAWEIATGITRQLTDFEPDKQMGKKPDAQSIFLQQQQLNTSAVLKARKERRAARAAYLNSIKDSDTIHIIYTGNRTVRSLQVNPDGRFISYNLFLEAENVKRTDVPTFVTESGYTTDIPSRSKVGAPRGNTIFYVFDRLKDTIINVKTDSLPGIKDRLEYLKDYPAKPSKDSSRGSRKVNVAAIYWNEEGAVAVLDISAQDNKDRWLMQLDAASGKLSLVDRQHDDAWIGGPGIGWLGGTNAGWVNEHVFYFQSELSGYSHLYTYDVNTQTKQQITTGKYEILDASLSNDKKYFYILTNEEHPGKRDYYRINTDGTHKIKITSMPGGYDVTMSPDEKYIAYRYSDQNKPWELYVQENAAGKKPAQVTDKAMSDEWKAYPWRVPKIFSFPNRGGLPVYARVYEPAAGKKNGAAVIFVHGAGYLQNVMYSWSSYFHEYMFNNLLADKGYTVLDIDYQASSGYGRDWRTAIYRHMGGKDLDDEVDAAKMLVKDYGINANKIGMYGGSYGGFMTLMALFTQPGIFKAGAALRPVTDWAHYNAGYTDAILNEPATDSIAYAHSSPINFAAGLQDHLLICHGMVDVNVHYEDAVRLAQRLIELGKDNWELASFPMEDHGFVEPTSWTDEYKRILKLFDENLLK